MLGQENGQMYMSSVALELKYVMITDLKQIMRQDLKEMDPINLTRGCLRNF